jgi:hypothetical protein
MNGHEFVRRLRVIRAKPSRLADGLREPRDIVIGGPLVNRLGLQVGRTLSDRIKWKLRSPRLTHDVTDAFETIEADGVVVIPNFLSSDAVAAVRRELAAIDAAGQYKTIPFGENFAANETLLTDSPECFPALMRSFRDNAFLLNLASAVSRRKMTYSPHVSVFKVFKAEPTKPHTDLDYNQYVHADRHYSFIKAFYYVDDVDAETAPYSYARRSHKVTLARLKYEYAYSIAFAKIRSNGYSRTPSQLTINQRLRELADTYLAEIGCHVEPIVAKANTLIVSNNIGFHRRGPMLGVKPRTTLNIDFKYLESPAQLLHPLLKHLYRSDQRP